VAPLSLEILILEPLNIDEADGNGIANTCLPA